MNIQIFLFFSIGFLFVNQALGDCNDECVRLNAQACRDARTVLSQEAGANGKLLWDVYNPDTRSGRRKLHAMGSNPPNRHRSLNRSLPANRPIPSRPGENGQPTLPDPLPGNYSVRDVYQEQCPVVKDVFNQGNCGNCWAMAVTSVINDRNCIYQPPGSQNIFVSASALTGCLYTDRTGCTGGWEGDAFNYWKNTGLPTGGDTTIGQTPAGCQPFQNGFVFTANHQCKATCDNGNVPSDADISKGAMTYQVPNNEIEIMKEIYLYGPVTASFDVYRDFWACYQGGIYKHVAGDYVSGHAVKVYGWGEENGTRYWLVQNSWGNWAEGGSFRILRGNNEVNFENNMNTGIPNIPAPAPTPAPVDKPCADDPDKTPSCTMVNTLKKFGSDYCQINPAYYKTHCKKTCNAC